MNYTDTITSFKYQSCLNKVIYETHFIIFLGALLPVLTLIFDFGVSTSKILFMLCFLATGIIGTFITHKKFVNFYIGFLCIDIFICVFVALGSNFYLILGFYYLLSLNCDPSFNGECSTDENISHYIKTTFGSFLAFFCFLTVVLIVSLAHAKDLVFISRSKESLLN